VCADWGEKKAWGKEKSWKCGTRGAMYGGGRFDLAKKKKKGKKEKIGHPSVRFGKNQNHHLRVGMVHQPSERKKKKKA